MAKKAKRKPRTRKLRGWVAVATDEFEALTFQELRWACESALAGDTKPELIQAMGYYHCNPDHYTILKIDIVATAKC